MEKIVSIHAMFTASTRHVTESMAVVCMTAKEVSNVTRVYFCEFDVSFQIKELNKNK